MICFSSAIQAVSGALVLGASDTAWGATLPNGNKQLFQTHTQKESADQQEAPKHVEKSCWMKGRKALFSTGQDQRSDK